MHCLCDWCMGWMYELSGRSKLSEEGIRFNCHSFSIQINTMKRSVKLIFFFLVAPFGGIILSVILISCEDRREYERKRAALEKEIASSEPIKKAPHSDWKSTYFTDDFGDRTGERGARTKALTTVGEWPYHDLNVEIFVHCRGRSWFRFDKSPNLRYSGSGDYRNIRIKTDDGRKHTFRVYYDRNSTDLNLTNDARFINLVKSKESLQVISPWHQQDIQSTFSLLGSTKTINESCG